MKTQSLTTIRNRALYNIYGDTVPEASLLARASFELLNVLEEVQRKEKLYFSTQITQITLPSGARSARVTVQNDGNGDDCIGEIFSVYVESGGVKREIPFKDYMAIFLAPDNTGTPTGWAWKSRAETYTLGVSAQTPDNIVFDKIADADYTVYVQYKHIYMPVDWTDPAVFMLWTSFVLDELEEYLTAKLTFVMAIIAGNSERASIYAQMADEALNTIYSKTDSKIRQVGNNVFTYKDL